MSSEPNPMSNEDIRIMLGQLRVALGVLKSASAVPNSAEYLWLSSRLLTEQIEVVVHRLEDLQVTGWTGGARQ
jgi:hypothetical protein